MYYSPFASIWIILYYLIAFLFYNAAIILELVGLWFTYRKMGLPGWKGIIPFYSSYVLFEKLWDKKMFWRVIIYLCISFGVSILGSVLMIIGAMNAASEAVNIILIALGVSFEISSVVLAILTIVIMFRLYKKMAHAFGLKDAWAWGLLFIPYVMLPIIGFNKNIIYYGPVNQV
ncbi:MAG: hypothetical protein IJH40_09210 [Ruminococcus sp.]|uniref:DUF5684 domain-containing protein n=1 Tax=Ruminococcus sp. TaxID=41978 RepID=UPI0028737209|nr:DUF5684 domain-containing protein [Ruminococcus sp.]MBQ3285801.1 hypothetical protein [Ruminococcus sp.]